MQDVTADEAEQMKVLSINLRVTCAHSELSAELTARVLREVANLIDFHSDQ
jgi:hypothetical protein